VKLTLGCKGDNWPYNGSIDAATSFGNEVVEAQIDQVIIDDKNRIVTTPAYMKGDATPSEVFTSCSNLVNTISQLHNNQNKSYPVTLVVNVEI
jgi:enhancing lycopene biosynthesis protein 2